jgi:hypothetical protein
MEPLILAAHLLGKVQRVYLVTICEGRIECSPAGLTQTSIRATILHVVRFICERESVTWILTIDDRVTAEWTRLRGGFVIPIWVCSVGRSRVVGSEQRCGQ